MTFVNPKILLASAATAALLVSTVHAGDSCCDAPSAKEAMMDISTEADAPSTQPATEAKKSAEALYAGVQAATDLPQALAAAELFVEAYPEDERSAQLLYVLGDYAEETEEKSAYLGKLVELHPESEFAVMAKAGMKQMEKIGQPFELTFTPLRSDEEMSLQEDLAGKVVVIDFWATWCGPCIAEMPKMKKLYAEYKDQGVEFIGVSLDAPEAEGGKDKLMAYVEENDIAWPQYYQGNGWQSEFSKSWGVNAIPQLFIIDAEGKLHSTEARGQLETLIPKLIAERDAQASAQ